jgi:hypothetical protein
LGEDGPDGRAEQGAEIEQQRTSAAGRQGLARGPLDARERIDEGSVEVENDVGEGEWGGRAGGTARPTN